MKEFLLLFFSFLFACMAKAQMVDDWTMPDTLTHTSIDSKQYSEILRAFNEKNAIQMVYHYGNCKWRGMNLQDFNDTFAPEEMGYDDKNYMKRLLLNFNDIMQQKSGLTVGNTAPFIAHVVINKVEMNAAIDAKALIIYKDSLPFALIDLNVDAGRWNKFSVLWRENTEKMAHILKKYIWYIRNMTAMNEQKYLLIKRK